MNKHKEVVPILRALNGLSSDELLNLLYEIAHQRPSILIKVFKDLGYDTESFEEAVRRIAEQKSKVQAIKFYREMKKTDLKTAKDAVDRIVGSLHR